MIRFRRMVTATVIISLLAIVPAFSQVTKTATSNTNAATMGYFGTDVDNFMSYHNYSKVDFEKYFGFVGYGDNISLGYATKLGENQMYLGLLYNGSVVSQTDASRTESVTPTYNVNDGVQESIQTTLAFADLDFTTKNSIAAILGLGNMGINVGFYETTLTRSNPTGVTTTITKNGDVTTVANEVESFDWHEYTFVPYAGWGMVMDMGDMVLKPYADVEFELNPDSHNQVLAAYVEEYGVVAAGKTLSITNGAAQFYMNPRADVGANLKMGDMQFGLGYGLSMVIYSNDYDVYGVNGSVSGTATWTGNVTETKGPMSDTLNRAATVQLDDISNWVHRITPSFKWDWLSTENILLGFSARVPVTLGFETHDTSTRTATFNETKYHFDPTQNTTTTTDIWTYPNRKTETSSLTVEPSVALGVNVRLKVEPSTAVFGPNIKPFANRLDLNAGIRVTPVTYNSRTTRTSPNGYQTTKTVTKDGDGNETANTVTTALNTPAQTDTKVEATSWGALNANIAAGFTFYFAENFTLDAAFGTAGSVNHANFDLDITQFNLIFTLKK